MAGRACGFARLLRIIEEMSSGDIGGIGENALDRLLYRRAQGFLFSEPLQAEAARELLVRSNA